MFGPGASQQPSGLSLLLRTLYNSTEVSVGQPRLVRSLRLLNTVPEDLTKRRELLAEQELIYLPQAVIIQSSLPALLSGQCCS